MGVRLQAKPPTRVPEYFGISYSCGGLALLASNKTPRHVAFSCTPSYSKEILSSFNSTPHQLAFDPITRLLLIFLVLFNGGGFDSSMRWKIHRLSTLLHKHHSAFRNVIYYSSFSVSHFTIRLHPRFALFHQPELCLTKRLSIGPTLLSSIFTQSYTPSDRISCLFPPLPHLQHPKQARHPKSTLDLLIHVNIPAPSPPGLVLTTCSQRKMIRLYVSILFCVVIGRVGTF